MGTPRREIKTRDSKWAQALSKFIAVKTNITPNDISVLSVLFGAIAFAAYCAYNFVSPKFYIVIPIVAIIGIQGRLICNLIDGMVAVEGGKKSVVGDIYNEFPDRLSDTLILVGAGIAGGCWESLSLGLLAALFAMFTAYTRVLAGAIGAIQRFLGPMAKQHRMALLTVASLICLFEPILANLHYIVYPLALIIIILGSIITVWRRVRFAAKDLIEKSEQ